jgi:hypothetical protein
MRWLLLLCLVAATKPAPAPPKNLWRALVQPNARWTLSSHDGAQITVETRDVRKIAGAEVARLRWTTTDKQDLGDPDRARPTQVAVTPAGVWFLKDEDDDAAVKRAVSSTKPTFADPPPVTPTQMGRYETVYPTKKGAIYCIGEGPPPDVTGGCDSVCFGEVCYAPDAGPVLIDGTWAPDDGLFAQPGGWAAISR